jgi:hypothetical protein
VVCVCVCEREREIERESELGVLFLRRFMLFVLTTPFTTV